MAETILSEDCAELDGIGVDLTAPELVFFEHIVEQCSAGFVSIICGQLLLDYKFNHL